MRTMLLAEIRPFLTKKAQYLKSDVTAQAAKLADKCSRD
jgi:hypothetical protein